MGEGIEFPPIVVCAGARDEPGVLRAGFSAQDAGGVDSLLRSGLAVVGPMT